MPFHHSIAQGRFDRCGFCRVIFWVFIIRARKSMEIAITHMTEGNTEWPRRHCRESCFQVCNGVG